MIKFPFLFGKKEKKNRAVSIDDYKENLLKSGSDSIIDNNEVILGGILEGRSPDFVDLAPNYNDRKMNSEFDILP